MSEEKNKVSSNPNTPPAQVVVNMPRQSSGWPIAVIVVAILVILAGVSTLFLYQCSKIAGTVPDAIGKIAGAFKSNVNVTTTMNITSSVLNQEPKLVVLTNAYTVEVTKSKETYWVWVAYMGTTTVNIKAVENHGQYYVPMNGIDEKNFQFDAVHHILCLTVPTPIFDEEMVDVQSDPSKISVQTTAGWASLKAYEGEKVREQVMTDLRPAVIAAGKKEDCQASAREKARKTLVGLLETTLGASLKPEVKVEVEFK